MKKTAEKNRLFVASNPVENAITSWISDMHERKVFVSVELIQEKARRIQKFLTQNISEKNQMFLECRRVRTFFYQMLPRNSVASTRIPGRKKRRK